MNCSRVLPDHNSKMNQTFLDCSTWEDQLSSRKKWIEWQGRGWWSCSYILAVRFYFHVNSSPSRSILSKHQPWILKSISMFHIIEKKTCSFSSLDIMFNFKAFTASLSSPSSSDIQLFSGITGDCWHQFNYQTFI